jgi:hypothetical protein
VWADGEGDAAAGERTPHLRGRERVTTREESCQGVTGDGAAQAVWWRREAARVAEAMNVKDVGERRWRDDGETMMCV